MKKFFLLLAVALTVTTAHAQKQTETKTKVTTDVVFEQAQARMPQVVVTPKVKPLICEVKIVPDAKNYFITELDQKQMASLENNLENIYNYGTFKWTQEAKCDMIVAPTYHLRELDDHSKFILEIKGFPANFVNWRTADEKDYEWLRITEGYNYYSNGVMNPLIKK